MFIEGVCVSCLMKVCMCLLKVCVCVCVGGGGVGGTRPSFHIVIFPPSPWD